MSTSTELSAVPMERLKAYVDNTGDFPWDDAGRAEPIVRNLCDELDREQELIMTALREGVPSALRRAFDRGQDQPPASNLRLVSRHLAKRVFLDNADADWVVLTLAVGRGLMPLPPSGAADMSSPSPGPAYNGHPDFGGAASAQPQTELERRLQGPPPRSSMMADASSVIAVPPLAANRQPDPASTTPPSGQAPRPHTASVNMTLPQDARAAEQRNNPYAAQQNPFAQPPSGQTSAGAGGSWPPAPGGGYGLGTVNDSGQKSGVPYEIAGFKWNWPAFYFRWIWCFTHNLPVFGAIFLGLEILSFFVPFVGFAILGGAIYLGINGHKLAWQNRQYDSVDHYIETETVWLRWFLGVLIGGFVLIIIGMSLMGAFFRAFVMGHRF